jgi:hypothetical protein
MSALSALSGLSGAPAVRTLKQRRVLVKLALAIEGRATQIYRSM